MPIRSASSKLRSRKSATPWIASVALAVVGSFAALLFSGWGDGAGSAQAAPKPNIVFILADDMRYDDLKYMPKTRSLLGSRGRRFKKDFVSFPVCCPSRATIMRGQYAHNTGQRSPLKGVRDWRVYKAAGYERDDVATRLHNAGYRTGLFGKYLNGYSAHSAGTYVPPGWDDWFATEIGYYDYNINHNGTIVHYGSDSSDYSTDVIAQQTKQFIQKSVERHKPFFAYVAPKAPHDPAKPAPRDKHTYDGIKAPRPPSFNEKDVSDKPPWIRSLPKLSDRQKAQIDAEQEKRAETLQALDDLVAGVVGKLKNEGVLHNTYIFFTSDNGWHQGEHRIQQGKGRPYEEDVHMPLLVRGPGVAAGSTTDKLALNTDFLPTFTDLAGIRTPSYVDGRSLRPVLKGKATTWRSAILLEMPAGGGQIINSYGIRTSDSKYIEYESGGQRELYNLKSDPYELSNRYKASSPPASLASRLHALKSCKADACRAAENGP
jgi:N-acetylglucosamine-6-sulfatase